MLGGGRSGELGMQLAGLVKPVVNALTGISSSEGAMSEAIAAVVLLGERAKLYPPPTLRGMPGFGIFAATSNAKAPKTYVFIFTFILILINVNSY